MCHLHKRYGRYFNFIIHILQALWIHKYIPSLITSILCLPFSIWLILKSFTFVEGPSWQVILWIVIGIVMVALKRIMNLKMGYIAIEEQFEQQIGRKMVYPCYGNYPFKTASKEYQRKLDIYSISSSFVLLVLF